MPAIIRQKLTAILLGTLIAIFALTYLVVNFGMYRPAKAKFDEGTQTLKTLKAEQAGKSELVTQIDEYRQGLYALSLLLDARQNVLSGSNPDNPYFVFDYYQVLQDLRRLLPPSARASQLQVNSKGLITIPIESTSYKMLGFVLRLFKDSDLFTEVKIPAGAQIVLSTSQPDTATQTDYGFDLPVAPPMPVYTLTLQATLNPDFWKNRIPFADVDPKASYANAIRDLYIAKAIEGYRIGDDFLFKPEQAINRAELLKIALFQSLRNDQLDYGEYQQYQDLSQEDWFYKAVQVASKMGVAEGDSTGRFHPEDTTSRLEALKMLLHIFSVPADEPAVTTDQNAEIPKPIMNPFSDVSDKDDFYPVIRTGIRNGLFANPNGEFKPEEPVTRAEVAYWTWKLMANEDSAKAESQKTDQTR